MDEFLGVAAGSWAAAVTGEVGDVDQLVPTVRALLRRVIRDPEAYSLVVQLFPTLRLIAGDGSRAFPEGYRQFGDYLRHLAAGRTQGDIGAQLGIGRGRVTNHLNNYGTPDLELLRPIWMLCPTAQ